MRRVIVDYKKLTTNILDLLVEKFPDGYGDSDIISFKNQAGELIEAVEVRTEDTVYLVKVSIKLEERLENFTEQDDDEDDDDFGTGNDSEVDIDPDQISAEND